jgi:hypothetical protein
MGAAQKNRTELTGASSSEPFAQEHILADPQALGAQGGARAVVQPCPVAFEADTDVNPTQPNRAELADAGSGEPAAQEHALADLQTVGQQGDARVVAQTRPLALKLDTYKAAGQVDCTDRIGTGGSEPAQGHDPADLCAFGVQGRARVVAQSRPVAVEVPANVGADQAHPAALAAPNDGCIAQAQLPAGEPGGVQGRLGGVFQVASA